MTDFQIRQANENDVKLIAGLENKCFSTPWSEQSFFEEITTNDIARYAVAAAGEQIIGYAGIWLVTDEGHITNVAVHPDFRRRGIARALVSSLIETSLNEGVDKFTLEVRASNKEAISLYKSLDFFECGIRREYYDDDGEDALIMWRT